MWSGTFESGRRLAPGPLIPFSFPRSLFLLARSSREAVRPRRRRRRRRHRQPSYNSPSSFPRTSSCGAPVASAGQRDRGSASTRRDCAYAYGEDQSSVRRAGESHSERAAGLSSYALSSIAGRVTETRPTPRQHTGSIVRLFSRILASSNFLFLFFLINFFRTSRLLLLEDLLERLLLNFLNICFFFKLLPYSFSAICLTVSFLIFFNLRFFKLLLYFFSTICSTVFVFDFSNFLFFSKFFLIPRRRSSFKIKKNVLIFSTKSQLPSSSILHRHSVGRVKK